MERRSRVNQDTEQKSQEDGTEPDPREGESEGGGGEQEEQEEDHQDRDQEPAARHRRPEEALQRRGILHIQS